jgi:hypothetical protein
MVLRGRGWGHHDGRRTKKEQTDHSGVSVREVREGRCGESYPEMRIRHIFRRSDGGGREEGENFAGTVGDACQDQGLGLETSPSLGQSSEVRLSPSSIFGDGPGISLNESETRVVY